MAAALAAMLPLAFAVPAQAAIELDQSQQAGFGTQSVQLMVQTFIAGKTGRLDHVDLKLSARYGALYVTVRQANPDGTPVAPASTDVTVVGTGAMFGATKFDFSQANVPITKGVTYEIFTKRAGPVYWYFTNSTPPVSPTFLGGKLYVSCVGCSTWFTGPGYGADFVFDTFVNTTTVQQPAITLDKPSATADEGASPTMTGTFSDPNGAFTLGVTGGGTVTPTSGTGTGTWSWTEPAADETSGQSVTVTLTDTHGLSASVPFPVTVNGVKPTVQIAVASSTLKAAQTLAGPVSVPEGSQITLTGSASSPDATDTAAGFKYAWTVVKDGSTQPVLSAASYSIAVGDESTWVVKLDATDDGGMTGSTTVTVVGTEITPGARIDSVKPTDPLLTSPLVIAPQESLSFAGSPVNAATPDTHTASWSFGDGQSAAGFAATHAYAAAGTYNVTLTVKDDDGATSQATTQVVVQTPQQVLSTMKAFIEGLAGLNSGQKNSLIAKLDAASASMDRGDTKTANNQLNAFLNELQAYQGSGKISAMAYNALVADVHAIKGALGTYNRFLEWWTLLA